MCTIEKIQVVISIIGYNSYNDQALLLAKKYDLLMTAGSDCHQEGDEASAGIVANVLPKDTFEMAALLRSGAYSLFNKLG